MSSRFDYLQHLLDCVDFVSSGKKGAISDDRKLIAEYNPSYYDMLQRYLKNSDQRVKIGVITLLTNLRERQAIGDIKELRITSNENVSNACVGFLYTMDTVDDYIPDLMDILKHKRGSEFRNAAARMRSVGREENIPELRKIYGQVDGEMREQMRECIEGIIDRTPSLSKKKRMLLSVPVFPDEDRFMSFADNTSVYLDIRYRDNVSEMDMISSRTYNNVAKALKKIQIRLFNEEVNLKYYSDEAKAAYNEINDLFIWALDDIKTKKILMDTPTSDMDAPDCTRCGNRMTYSKNGWRCPICGSSH